MSLLVQHFLEDSARRHPDKTALVCDDLRLSYAQVEEQSNRLAHALLERGIRRGDRVVTLLPNSVEAVIAIFGILKAAGVFVPLNPTTKRDKLTYILNDCRAAGLITLAENSSLAAQAARAVPSLSLTILCGQIPSSARVHAKAFGYEALLRSCPANPPACPTIDQDLACLIYTSGSTGEPKGVVSGHNNVAFASWSIITFLQNRAEDIVIDALPLSFDYGLYQLLMTFRFGGTLVLERSFSYPVQILRRIETEKVTGFPVVPTMVAMILQMDLGKFDLTSLRYVTNTAAALPPQHIVALGEKLRGVTLYSMYGLTECKRALYLPPEQLNERPGSVGIAIPGTEVWLEEERGNRVGPGGTGELVIRGSHVMRGYWEAPDATARVYRPGPTPGERVLYSGDLFRMDQDGYLYFLSRKDDVIKSRGEKVAPKEIENVLYEIPQVVEAAVVGVPDPVLGQAIKAYIVSSDAALSAKDVKKHCAQKLESFMVPQHIEFRDSLPKTASGKIRKQDLAAPG